MKNITIFLSKQTVFVLLLSVFFFASCSKQTANVSQYSKLAYEQTITANANEEIAQVPLNVNEAETSVEMAAAPMIAHKAIETKTQTQKSKKNKFAAVNKLKENGAKKIKNISVNELASVSLLASAAKDKNKSMLEGKLRLAIIFLLVGLILGIFGGIIGLIGYIFVIIGIIFLVLWLLEQI